MTVRELISVLSQLPNQEAEVYTSWDDGLGGSEVRLEQIGIGRDEDGQYVVFAEPDGFRKGETPVAASIKGGTDTALTVPGRWIGEVSIEPEPLPDLAERLNLSLIVPPGKAQEVVASAGMARMADVGALPMKMTVFGWVADSDANEGGD